MKGIDNKLCASQASTAICSSMDQPSTSSTPSCSSTVLLGGRAIDRHNPIIRDPKRTPKAHPATAPCISQPHPINPKPYHLLNKRSSSKNKNNSPTPNDQTKKRVSFLIKPKDQTTNKSSSRPTPEDFISSKEKNTHSNLAKHVVNKRWSIDPGVDFVNPPGSSRYLLGDTTKFFDELSDHFDVVLPEANKNSVGKNNGSSQALVTIAGESNDNQQLSALSSSPPETERPSNQVVVLRVSLHCKACEGKVRKHLSRMEGVTNYSIDFGTKKVTIVGDVTPSSVLASVSKVKNAQFWTSTTTATTASTNSPISRNI